MAPEPVPKFQKMSIKQSKKKNTNTKEITLVIVVSLLGC
jgi:hypothetical protein